MVGGIVIEVADVPDRPDIVFVDTANRTDHRETCALYVERNARSEQIREGDAIWWQGCMAMWTPQRNYGSHGGKCGVDYDIEIPRRGYSGVRHPSRT